MYKHLSDVEIKNADLGEVSAVFATLNVKDRDGDVTLPGAFTNGAEVRISAYGHQSWSGALPVGKGTIREDGDLAIFEGSFFLDTTSGRDTFNTVKNLGPLGEWSYSLHNVTSEKGELDGEPVNFLKSIHVHEVSPVLMGAGIDTRTLATKGGLKFSEHIASVRADVEALLVRASEVVALRAEKGKTIASESADLMGLLGDDLEQLAAEAKALAVPATTTEDDTDLVLNEYLRFVALSQGVRA